MSAARHFRPVLGSIERHDCTTCACSTVGAAGLACDQADAADPASRIGLWRGSVAELGPDGFPVRASLTPCPGWSPAWGES